MIYRAVCEKCGIIAEQPAGRKNYVYEYADVHRKFCGHKVKIVEVEDE